MTKLNTPKEPDTAVGVQLQNLRVFRGLSREGAAGQLGVSPGFVDALESGYARPHPDLLLQMARIYDVPPSRVFAICAVTQDPDQEPGR